MAGYVTLAIAETDESARTVLEQLRTAGFELQAAGGGDILRIRPAERVTPEVRDLLARHKPALLQLLAPSRRFVTLKPDVRTGQALTLPVEVIQLALRLEDRGIRLHTNEAHRLVLPPDAPLTADDRATIERWERHLAALAKYEPPEVA